MHEEHLNPFGGFVFSGPDEALALIIAAAERDGIKFLPVNAGDGVVRDSLPPEHAFAEAAVALVNRAQAGEFGELSLGLLGAPPQPPH